jgi:fumarate reductase iron-sulfur subunit
VVCPQGVDPAHAINQNKMRSTLDYLGLPVGGEPP